MMKLPNILEVMHAEKLFARWFDTNWRGANTWKGWESFLAALFALPMTAEMHATYKKFTGRDDVPNQQVSESYLVKGRRAGGSIISAFIGTYLATFRDYSKVLAPGEIGTLPIIASDKRQARNILNYVNGFFDEIPILSRMVAHRTKESITLTNQVRIEVHTASFRSVRGYTIITAILDELAFFQTGDSANPDVEIVNALRPAMATIPNSLLLGISSPYARRGVLWDAFHDYYGKANAPVLVWKADSRSMNPKLNPVTIALAYARDAAKASAEYGAEFRTDVEAFLTLELVQAATRNVTERAPLNGITYSAFVDPSGGQSDSFTLAVAHTENDTAILDLLVEAEAPFSPEAIVAKFCGRLKAYRVSEVTGDRYAGSWPREQFEKRGVSYRVAELTRSEYYLELLPLLTSGNCELLKNKRLETQLVGLERRTARSGKDSVDHQPGGHDDLANSVAGVLTIVSSGAGVYGVLAYDQQVAAGMVTENEFGMPSPGQRAIVEQLKRERLKAQIEAQNVTSNPFSAAARQQQPLPPCPACTTSANVHKIDIDSFQCCQCSTHFGRTRETERHNRRDVFDGNAPTAKVSGPGAPGRGGKFGRFN
jgi:hypothetical protein